MLETYTMAIVGRQFYHPLPSLFHPIYKITTPPLIRTPYLKCSSSPFLQNIILSKH